MNRRNIMSALALLSFGLALVAPDASAYVNSNRANRQAVKALRGIGEAVQVQKATYSFAVQGGSSAADVTLTGPAIDSHKIPAGAIVTKIMTNERSNLTVDVAGTTMTLKCGSQSLSAALTAANITGVEDQALASSAEGIAITSECVPKMAIGVHALTAGVVDFYVDYRHP